MRLDAEGLEAGGDLVVVLGEDEGLDGLLRAGQEHVYGVGEGDDLHESVDDVGQGLVVDQQNRKAR